jgi:transcriptional regulator with XRE-family HTH domain
MSIGEWIEKEKERLHLKSNRAFAEKAGVSPQLINDLVNATGREPDIGSLAKISAFTGTSLIALLKLVFPEVVRVDVDVDEMIYAEMLSKLPPDEKRIARSYIDSAYRESGNQ